MRPNQVSNVVECAGCSQNHGICPRYTSNFNSMTCTTPPSVRAQGTPQEGGLGACNPAAPMTSPGALCNRPAVTVGRPGKRGGPTGCMARGETRESRGTQHRPPPTSGAVRRPRIRPSTAGGTTNASQKLRRLARGAGRVANPFDRAPYGRGGASGPSARSWADHLLPFPFGGVSSSSFDMTLSSIPRSSASRDSTLSRSSDTAAASALSPPPSPSSSARCKKWT